MTEYINNLVHQLIVHNAHQLIAYTNRLYTSTHCLNELQCTSTDIVKVSVRSHILSYFESCWLRGHIFKAIGAWQVPSLAAFISPVLPQVPIRLAMRESIQPTLRVGHKPSLLRTAALSVIIFHSTIIVQFIDATFSVNIYPVLMNMDINILYIYIYI